MENKTIFERKNVLVTGGAGFIGSFLCEALLKDSKVICVDNFVSGSRDNIEQMLRDPNFIFLKHDMRDPLDFSKYPEIEQFKVEFQGIQEIYNMASPTSPKEFDEQKINSLEANSSVMKNVLDLTVQMKAKLVHASSSVVYGSRPANSAPFTEEFIGAVDFMSPRACYDEGKRFAETMVATYRQVYDIDAKSARIFRTYGPRMPLAHGHMLPDFIANALDGKPVVIYGDETFATSLVYVSDVVDALMKLMAAPKDTGAVNIGSDDDVTLNAVAKMIIEKTGSASTIEFKERLLFMSELGLPDLSKVKECLGWLPVVTLKQGMDKMIEYTMAEKGLVR